jgi:hypothetical protein
MGLLAIIGEYISIALFLYHKLQNSCTPGHRFGNKVAVESAEEIEVDDAAFGSFSLKA